ncbi:MAG: DUF11 domain-containing protein [Desulfobacterales bacterium]|nr:DUF11 domain-containing protein [Desulfobacterales bacterium]
MSGSISNGGAHAANGASPDTVIWNSINILAGASKTFTFQVTVDSATSVTNTVDITAADQPDVDDTFGDATYNEDRATISVDGREVDLLLDKSIASGPTWDAAGYYTVDFTLKVTNQSTDDDATNVKVEDTLPSGLVFLSNTAPSSGTYNSGTGVWSVGTVAASGNETLTMTVRVNNTASVSNYAEITAADQPVKTGTLGDGSTTEPDDDSETINVELIDLSLSKEIIGVEPTADGDSIEYKVTLTNASGFDEATNIDVTETLPAGLAASPTITANTGTYNSGVWEVGSLFGHRRFYSRGQESEGFRAQSLSRTERTPGMVAFMPDCL